LLIGYGLWLIPSPSREVEFLPGHNSSYKRDVMCSWNTGINSLR
jgi:hypothetical protein